MRILSAVFCAFLSLSFCLSATAQLKHYCKNEDVIGRTNYACGAAAGINSGLTELSAASTYPKYAEIRKECKTQCFADGQCKKEEDQAECRKDCQSDCETSFFKKAAKPLLKGLKAYDTECRKSQNASSCEKNEAKPYCDYSIYPSAKKYSKATKYNEFSKILKAHKKVVGKYSARSANLAKEIAERSAAIRTKVNQELGCEYLTEGFTACNSTIAAAPADQRVDEFTAIYVLNIKNNEKGYCQKGKGCVVDACTKGRDDNAYTTEADGASCYCDQYCCEAGDCCENFAGICAGSVDVSLCTKPITAAYKYFTPARGAFKKRQ